MDLSHRMIHSASVEDVASLDASGDPTFAAARTIVCRHERRRVSYRNAAGEMVPADDVIYSYSAVAVGARITLADETIPRIVMAVGLSPSSTGSPDLYKIIPSGQGGLGG